MLYHLFQFLHTKFDFAGSGLFQYISFRSGMAVILSILISVIFGERLIKMLQKLQVGESIRDLGLEGQMEKKGTPTMGGLIIILSIVLPTVLFARLDNVYIILLLVTTLWMGTVGFIDDYIKVFKKDKEGLSGKFKIVGQVGLGLIVGLTLYFNDDVVVREFDPKASTQMSVSDKTPVYNDVKSTKTTMPFFKNNEADYNVLNPFDSKYTWIIYVLIATFIITAVSNGANITDGIDGLAAGTTAIIVGTLGVLAYVSGRVDFSQYLNIMYIPNSGELLIFSTALVGATVGFLWYNSYPAQVFMGDTGSLALGGIVAVFALVIRKELLIPILCGIYLIELLSVIVQVSYFKYTKKKYGEGRRIFLMSPLHHHYQKKLIPEPKIVTRFWIIGILLAILTLATLKIR
ncbi:MAG: phospho-N-acetylmuramoyl-pentapeptide-transferase [Cyclobacteriaceae bacterium]|nr:phospho-N-acetylmuramoyl-pentapeptide-transferase [Cyclobacteriaceae bacterium]